MHYRKARRWLLSIEESWGTCPLSESGYFRVIINHRSGGFTLEEAREALAVLVRYQGFRFWPISAGWAEISAPIMNRIYGHQQVPDAYLLGLAIKENGVLVTFDKGIRHLAGERYSKNVLVLE
jgi:predicted nucleic acid-binding protein